MEKFNTEKILDYSKYKNKMQELYPSLSEEERERIFHLRVDFWKMIVDNFDRYYDKK